jgi:hypothetical protein
MSTCIHYEFCKQNPDHQCVGCEERVEPNLEQELKIAREKILEQAQIIDLANMEIRRIQDCRDHWKTSFEHERENVIRLRLLVYEAHGKDCMCTDCLLARYKQDRKEPK